MPMAVGFIQDLFFSQKLPPGSAAPGAGSVSEVACSVGITGPAGAAAEVGNFSVLEAVVMDGSVGLVSPESSSADAGETPGAGELPGKSGRVILAPLL